MARIPSKSRIVLSEATRNKVRRYFQGGEAEGGERHFQTVVREAFIESVVEFRPDGKISFHLPAELFVIPCGGGVGGSEEVEPMWVVAHTLRLGDERGPYLLQVTDLEVGITSEVPAELARVISQPAMIVTA